MSRMLFEAVPVTTELDMRLRRLESRIAQTEAMLRERATPAPVAPAPAPVAPAPIAPAPVAPAPVPVAPAPDRRWAEIGSRLEALALKLKLHYEQAGGERAPHALDELGDRVQDAFTAAGNAIHDEAVRSDIREVGAMVGEALADAMTTAGEDMRVALRRAEARKGGTP